MKFLSVITLLLAFSAQAYSKCLSLNGQYQKKTPNNENRFFVLHIEQTSDCQLVSFKEYMADEKGQNATTPTETTYLADNSFRADGWDGADSEAGVYYRSFLATKEGLSRNTFFKYDVPTSLPTLSDVTHYSLDGDRNLVITVRVYSGSKLIRSETDSYTRLP